MSELQALANDAKAWPFKEAKRLLQHIGKKTTEREYVLFETGYGPSGLPHIGTFGEVARTCMVRDAFSLLSNFPTRLFAFSDDMDGLRKVPDNIPNGEIITPHLGKPLTSIPDPFGTHQSFGHHNNARLQSFLDDFGFDYEFVSATDCYKEGLFDNTLMRVLQNYDEIMRVIVPTLGIERQATYSPFLPICPETGIVLQVPVIQRDEAAGLIVYERADGKRVETLVTGGHCKLQWKVDWAMRWAALGVDYEMSGKDLIDSVKLSSEICRILNGAPPVGFTYELFLDENGEKISKSVGNGLSVEEWLRYAPPESLSHFMFQKPKTAKRLYFDVIPKNVDEYLQHLDGFSDQDLKKQLENPVWHIHRGDPPHEDALLSYNILLNLAGVCHTEDKNVLWHFITRYRPNATVENNPILDQLVARAINYYHDFIKPFKQYRSASKTETLALQDLRSTLDDLEPGVSAEDIQANVYEIGKRHNFENLKEWFRCLYEVLLGQEKGPRIGSFILLYGIHETKELLDRAIAGEDLSS